MYIIGASLSEPYKWYIHAHNIMYGGGGMKEVRLQQENRSLVTAYVGSKTNL